MTASPFEEMRDSSSRSLSVAMLAVSRERVCVSLDCQGTQAEGGRQATDRQQQWRLSRDPLTLMYMIIICLLYLQYREQRLLAGGA